MTAPWLPRDEMFLTAEKAAELAGCAPEDLEAAFAAGDIGAIRPEGVLLFPRPAVLAWVRRRDGIDPPLPPRGDGLGWIV